MDLETQYDRIYRYCYFKVHNSQVAEDITQETFLRFFKKKLSLDSDKELPYLYIIARNLCIEEYRRISKEISCEIIEQLIYDPSDDWANSITIKNIIKKLPDDEQEFLLLRYANEVPINSISKITGLSRFALYRKNTKILKFLKLELQKGGFPDEQKYKKSNSKSI